MPNIISFCDAIVKLLHPLVEIVMHDLSTEKIVYISGDLSKRTVGDPSLLHKEGLAESDLYTKLNFDGRLIRSISVPWQNMMICINCDVSVFSQMQSLSQQFFTQEEKPQPQNLFKNDWQEKLHITIHAKLEEKGWIFEDLSNAQKKELVHHLFSMGAFAEKNAADYIAKILDMGRATVFNYLKKMRKK